MRRYLTTALVSAALASATTTVASADPLSALFGGLFGARISAACRSRSCGRST
jgi:hypothetical protein